MMTRLAAEQVEMSSAVAGPSRRAPMRQALRHVLGSDLKCKRGHVMCSHEKKGYAKDRTSIYIHLHTLCTQDAASSSAVDSL
jgi:hypothetical protein